MKDLKYIRRFNESEKNLNISDVSDSDIPQKIQDKYNLLIFRLRDGSADPDINEVEDKIEKIRKKYPNIKRKY